MVNFDCVYNIINDEEKRNVVTALIKEIEIYRNDESEYPLKRIGLNFPVFKDGGEVTELLWDKGNTVETVPVENSLYFFQACLQQGVSAELHIYPVGGHGLSLANEETCRANGIGVQKECQSWIGLAQTWLEEILIKN